MWFRRKRLPDPREAEPFWPESCPKCGSDKLQKIVFGIPSDNERLLKKWLMAIYLDCEADIVNLPHWYCRKCKHGWQNGGEWLELLRKYSKAVGDP